MDQMTDIALTILPETPDDAIAVERLHARTFGPGRFARTAFRIRERGVQLPDLSFTARIGTLLVGSVRLTAIRIGEAEGLLLGPLTVEPPFRTPKGLSPGGAGRRRTLLRQGRIPAHSQRPGPHAGAGRSRPAAGGGTGRRGLRGRVGRDSGQTRDVSGCIRAGRADSNWRCSWHRRAGASIAAVRACNIALPAP
jgi:hypothetical protein